MSEFSALLNEIAASLPRDDGASGARQRFAAAPPLAKAAGLTPTDLPALLRELRAGAGELERRTGWLRKALHVHRAEQAQAAERGRLERIAELADRLIEAGELPPSLAAGIDRYLNEMQGCLS